MGIIIKTVSTPITPILTPPEYTSTADVSEISTPANHLGSLGFKMAYMGMIINGYVMKLTWPMTTRSIKKPLLIKNTAPRIAGNGFN